jgi:hypothetical protein
VLGTEIPDREGIKDSNGWILPEREEIGREGATPQNNVYRIDTRHLFLN